MFRQHAPLSVTTLRFGIVTLFMISCAPTPEEPGGGNGGSVSSFGGSQSLGGFVSSFGGGQGFGGSTSSSGGTTTAAGGSTTTTSGGTTTTAGGSTSSASCDPLKVTEKTVYDGAGSATCGNSTKTPFTGYWYTFNDESAGSTQTPAKGADGSYSGEAPGKGGAMDCGFHTKGSGFGKWGGGVGIDFHNYMSKSCPLDGTAFSGIQFSVKGTTTGTQGAMYAAAENTLRVNLQISTDFGGDDYGAFCTLTADWTTCKVDFAAVTRLGYNSMTHPGTFDKTKLIKIQFQASKLMTATAVTFDFWVDDLTFY